MPTWDLSNYQGRQAARDAGYWVGDSGQGITAEKRSENAQIPERPQGAQPPSNVSRMQLESQGPLYDTINGPRTAQQMQQELGQAGWAGPTGSDNILTAYARTTGAPVTQSNAAGDAAARNAAAAAAQSAADKFALEQQKLGLDRQRLESELQRAQLDMQLARNADARAEATLRIAQASQALAEQSFKESQLQFRQSQYTDLAKTLLSGAASLRGPRDWVQYSQFTGGGKNLNEQLYGGQANAAFGGEAGPSPAISVGDVMGQLGFVNGSPPMAQAPQNVPLPHQINPASWDQFSESTRELVRGLAESGRTSNGVYTPADYERILNASRPFGTAPRTTQSTFGQPVGAF